MKKWLCFLLIIPIFLFGINNCSMEQSHPTSQTSQLNKLIPIDKFFLNPKIKFAFKISPDGQKLAWLELKNNRMTIFFKNLNDQRIYFINTNSNRNIYRFYWLLDSQRLLYRQDQAGNENYHIYMLDCRYPDKQPINLTPYENTRAWVNQIIRTDPDHILVSHNRRDKRVFDLYKVNLNTRQESLVSENPGTIRTGITDDQGNLHGLIKKTLPNKRIMEFYNSEQKKWQQVASWSIENKFKFLSFTADKKKLWMLSNRGRDRIALVQFDPGTGEETPIYEDANVDLKEVLISALTKKPVAALSFPGYPRLHFFERSFAKHASHFKTQKKSSLLLMSSDSQEKIFTLGVYTDKGIDFYLYNRTSQQKTLLARHPIYPYEQTLADMKPIVLKSRDGLTLHGYLTLPKEKSPKKLPMVLKVHGGPWARDYWGYNEEIQFLANRGYAVLQINYRGSIGYGRAFEEAAVGEFAGKMHDDLLDGVRWAVNKGIADPKKIAIMGRSYGGYAALVGMTFTPDTFACGIDVVGPSNLVSLLESVPKYWKPWLGRWYKYVGNPQNLQDRYKMMAKSPFFQIDNIKKPLFIVQGANDPRVNRSESDQIVAAMQKAGLEVEYLLFANEGHWIRNGANRLEFYQRLEYFLAKHLGGRKIF